MEGGSGRLLAGAATGIRGINPESRIARLMLCTTQCKRCHRCLQQQHTANFSRRVKSLKSGNLSRNSLDKSNGDLGVWGMMDQASEKRLFEVQTLNKNKVKI